MAKSKKKQSTARNKKPKKPVKKVKKSPSLFWFLSKWCLILSIWGALFTGAVLLYFAQSLPDITQGATFEHRRLIEIKSADGKTLARYGESKGENLRVEELPTNLVNAVLAIEDRRFYEHPGVDILGIARAMVANLIKGRVAQGGSTITQQLAKNLFLTHERSYTRKIKEALLALWLEHELSKNEILSAYMNRVYLGSGTYGFDAASRLYFGKSARYVNLRESAVLAGLLKAPSRYSPHNNLELSKERSDVVLKAMLAAGYITTEDMTGQNMLLMLPHRQKSAASNTRYFTDWVIDGVSDLIGNSDIDVIVETTLDSKLQERAYQALKSNIDNTDEMQFVSQGGILSVAPNGAILAMVGGYSYTQSQFNRATLAKRSPGSAFKPVVYLTALEKGWKPDDKILDAPITEGEYRPKNFADKYYGDVTLTTGLTKSLNTVSVRLAEKLTMGPIIATAKKMGIISPLQRDLSLALGSSGVSMLEMATAYSMIANGGYQIYPYGITRISTPDGTVIYDHKIPTNPPRPFSASNIEALTLMMQNVIQNGTGRAAQLDVPAAGKTGTSQNSRDAWFAGFTDSLVTVVWLGNDDNSPMRHVTGGGLPAQIWQDVMSLGITRNYESLRLKTGFGSGITSLLGRLLSSSTSHSAKDTTSDYSTLNE